MDRSHHWLPDYAHVDKLVKSLLSKGRGISVRIRAWAPEYADVMELVYMLVLETKSCEFESRHPHQCLVISVVECLLYTEKVGSSNLSRGTKLSYKNKYSIIVFMQD